MNDKFDFNNLGQMLNSIQSRAKELEEKSNLEFNWQSWWKVWGLISSNRALGEPS